MAHPELSRTRTITLCVNGVHLSGSTEPRVHLADFLRGELGLKGTHVGCEHGVCGACTVIVDGVSARSCLMLAVQGEGAEITTIEGLALPNGDPHPLQQAFHEHHALQCGFCTPGILMSLKELLDANQSPDERTVREVLSGHLCRCTGYQNIVAATMRAAQIMRALRDAGQNHDPHP